MLHHFRCDSCNSNFSRDISQISHTRLNNFVKHYCSNCKSAIGYSSSQKKKQNTQTNIGHKLTTKHGYVEVCVGHNSNYSGVKGGYIREHVKVMQDHLGRQLVTGEVVHHIDGNKSNNDISNLDLCTVDEHNNAHAKLEQIVFALVKQGEVIYDRATKRYVLLNKE